MFFQLNLNMHDLRKDYSDETFQRKILKEKAAPLWLFLVPSDSHVVLLK